MVQLDWPLSVQCRPPRRRFKCALPGRNDLCLSAGRKLHNDHHPGHEKYQDKYELKLRRYVLDQHIAALERRIPRELRNANELEKKSAKLHAKSNELGVRARAATRKEAVPAITHCISSDLISPALNYPARMKCPHCGKRIPDSLVRSHMGELGRKTLAKHGSSYFKALQSKRKTRAGGRPRTKKNKSL